MKIKLDKKTKIIVQPEKAIETTEVEVERVVYLPKQGVLRVICSGGMAPVETAVAENGELAVALVSAATAALRATLK